MNNSVARWGFVHKKEIKLYSLIQEHDQHNNGNANTMSYSRITLLSGLLISLFFFSGCSLIGLASMKKAEAYQKRQQQREKVVENMKQFEMNDIYFNNWVMGKIVTSKDELIEMNYRGRMFVNVQSPESDSIYSLPISYNRMVFFSDGEMIAMGNLNSVNLGENGVWAFGLVDPDTTLLSLTVDSIDIMVDKELTFDALRYGLDRFVDLPFEQTADEYSHSRYKMDVEQIRSWGLGGATSDSTYRVVQLNHIEEVRLKSGPVPPTGMGASIFMGFAVVADIVILTTLGFIWLL